MLKMPNEPQCPECGGIIFHGPTCCYRFSPHVINYPTGVGYYWFRSISRGMILQEWTIVRVIEECGLLGDDDGTGFQEIDRSSEAIAYEWYGPLNPPRVD